MRSYRSRAHSSLRASQWAPRETPQPLRKPRSKSRQGVPPCRYGIECLLGVPRSQIWMVGWFGPSLGAAHHASLQKAKQLKATAAASLPDSNVAPVASPKAATARRPRAPPVRAPTARAALAGSVSQLARAQRGTVPKVYIGLMVGSPSTVWQSVRLLHFG
jgi:hypothetical protein